jgi:hypothetical protein
MKGEIHSAICSSGMGMEKKLTTFMFVLTIGWRCAYRLFGIILQVFVVQDMTDGRENLSCNERI